jgi:RimJ/RimL family protein N-acetyltransferase
MPEVNLPYEFAAPLRTSRLLLRTITAADVDDIHAYQSRADVCRYLEFEPRTREQVAERVAKYARAVALRGDGDFWRLAIERASHPGRVIGDVHFSIRSLANATGEIGWTLHPDFAGHGYMTEAAGAVLEIAFARLGLHRVRAELDPRNDTSIALCRRLGMREEAYFVEDLWLKGEWGDTGIYAILDREWAPARSGAGAREAQPAVEMRDVAPGLWLWRQPHPAWEEGADWEAEVASFAVESRGVAILLDPLAPAAGAREVWERLDRLAPSTVIVLKPDHVRDVDRFVRRYGAAAYGPQLFWRDDVPRSELAPVQPGDELPGGLTALYDGRNVMETPVHLPEQRVLVFADAMTAPRGVLRVWHTPWHEERTLPALRALLELDFEHVLVSHGEPVHDRAEFVAALEREPWSDWTGA